MDLNALLTAHGGILRTSVLLGWGVRKHLIRAEIANGRLSRPRRGWIQSPSAAVEVVAAVAAGGRLACISATARHGLWTPTSSQLHVAFPAHSGHASSGHIVAHWDSERWLDVSAPVESVRHALSHALECLPHEQAVAVLDSALHRGDVSREDIESLASNAGRAERLLRDSDGASESGYETYVRLRFRHLGLRVRTQVVIIGVGRVDLIIGDRLVIEVDSRTWHDSDDAFLTDRSRDLILVRAGYLVVRLATHHIDHEWQWVEQVVRALVGRGDHLWSARFRGGELELAEAPRT